MFITYWSKIRYTLVLLALSSTQGLYTRNSCMSISSARNNTDNIPSLTQLITTYFWAAYSSINGSYMAIATVFLVVLLSFMLPDISHKIYRTKELRSMKKVLELISDEVSKTEVACLTVSDKLDCIENPVKDVTTETISTLAKDQQDLAVCTSGSIAMRTTQSAPAKVPKKTGLLQRIFFSAKNASNKEVTLMSYLYTDSFDALTSTKDKPQSA